MAVVQCFLQNQTFRQCHRLPSSVKIEWANVMWYTSVSYTHLDVYKRQGQKSHSLEDIAVDSIPYFKVERLFGKILGMHIFPEAPISCLSCSFSFEASFSFHVETLVPKVVKYLLEIKIAILSILNLWYNETRYKSFYYPQNIS